jgi:hypothetical protein
LWGHKGTKDVGERISGEGSGVRDERRETKILLEGEQGFGYFGPREIAKRHLTGYSRDLTEGWLWQGMRSISI